MHIKNFFFIITLLYTANASAFSVEHDFLVHIGAFDAAKVNFTYQLNPKDYGIRSQVSTNGFFNTIYPFVAQYDTSGTIQNDKMITRDYQYISRSRFKTRSKQVIFDNSGQPISQIVVTNDKKKTRDFKPSPTPADTFDLQTIMMKIAYQYNKFGFCASDMAVYDGKRRFDVEVTDLGYEDITANEYSSFAGSANRCSMHIKKNLSEDDDTLWEFASNKPIDFWIMRDTKSNHPFIVRIKIKDTPLGELNAYATKLNIEE